MINKEEDRFQPVQGRGSSQRRYAMPPTKKWRQEYENWIDTNPICACGCGKPLKTSFSSFTTSMYRKKRPPEILPGHINTHNKEHLFPHTDYITWYNQLQHCEICGKVLALSYRIYALSIKKTGCPPIIHPECRPKYNKKRMNFNGCIVKEVAEGRCQLMDKCKYYRKCLDMAISNKMQGWKIV